MPSAADALAGLNRAVVARLPGVAEVTVEPLTGVAFTIRADFRRAWEEVAGGEVDVLDRVPRVAFDAADLPDGLAPSDLEGALVDVPGAGLFRIATEPEDNAEGWVRCRLQGARR